MDFLPQLPFSHYIQRKSSRIHTIDENCRDFNGLLYHFCIHSDLFYLLIRYGELAARTKNDRPKAAINDCAIFIA